MKSFEHLRKRQEYFTFRELENGQDVMSLQKEFLDSRQENFTSIVLYIPRIREGVIPSHPRIEVIHGHSFVSTGVTGSRGILGGPEEKIE